MNYDAGGTSLILSKTKRKCASDNFSCDRLTRLNAQITVCQRSLVNFLDNEYTLEIGHDFLDTQYIILEDM